MIEIETLNNLESVGDMVGSLKGISEGLEEDEYIGRVIRDAHSKATMQFDIAAAATASAGHLKHVFEFGTAGITEGKVKFTDPTSASARLWMHKIEGRGGNLDIGYTFRPALNRNPDPTTRSTGVPSKYLRKLSKRKYVFWNKAFVMETGQTVEIKSERGDKGFLFVPTPGFNSPRNFVLYPSKIKGPINSVPGQSTQGTFTAFWVRWWGSVGGDLIEADMRKTVSTDIERAVAAAAKKANAERIKPAELTNVVAASEKARRREKNLFGRKK